MVSSKTSGLVKGLGLLDATTLVMGSMIGSGIFIVAADIARQTQSAGLLIMTWIVTATLTLIAALSYGELAAAMPHAGGQYVYLREAFGPLSGFRRNANWSFDTVRLVGVAMVGALFSSDAWNNVTFTAGEVRNPKRNLPISLALGVGLVSILYIACNFVYLSVLPLAAIQNAPEDRVATAV